jgi:hypothetical protein
VEAGLFATNKKVIAACIVELLFEDLWLLALEECEKEIPIIIFRRLVMCDSVLLDLYN